MLALRQKVTLANEDLSRSGRRNILSAVFTITGSGIQTAAVKTFYQIYCNTLLIRLLTSRVCRHRMSNRRPGSGDRDVAKGG